MRSWSETVLGTCERYCIIRPSYQRVRVPATQCPSVSQPASQRTNGPASPGVLGRAWGRAWGRASCAGGRAAAGSGSPRVLVSTARASSLKAQRSSSSHRPWYPPSGAIVLVMSSIVPRRVEGPRLPPPILLGHFARLCDPVHPDQPGARRAGTGRHSSVPSQGQEATAMMSTVNTQTVWAWGGVELR